MPAPTYISSTYFGTASTDWTVDKSWTVTVPTGTDFAICLMTTNNRYSQATARPQVWLNSVAATAQYDGRSGYRTYRVLYWKMPASGSRTFRAYYPESQFSAAVSISFYSGVDQTSPIVSQAAQAFYDIYTSTAVNLASNTEYKMWSCADQVRWQTDQSRGYLSSPWTTYVQGLHYTFGKNNGINTDETFTQASVGGYAPPSNATYGPQWNYPWLGSPLVYVANLRGITSFPGFSQSVCLF